MRKCLSVFARYSLVLAALLTPAVARAQFQPPTPDELKMTADPAAPGAAAVYLYKEETSDETLHYQTYYVRIKVLTEKGKELATRHVPYQGNFFKVTDIAGRTIHPDGTVVPLTVKPEDLTVARSGSNQLNMSVFTLPDVTVGSILEYRWQLRYGDNWYFSPQWEIQEPYFIHKAHYVYKPAPVGMMRKIVDSKGNYLNRLMWTTTGFDLDKVKVDTAGRYMLDLTDIPALTDEDWTPPLNTLKWGVRFYYSDAMSGGDYWKGAGKQWEKDTNSFIDSAKQLSPAVAELVAPTDTQEQKARKIYAAVMKLDNTDFSRKRSESELKAENLKDAKNAADVWNQKSGTGDQLALLYVGLARAAGLKAWPGVVANRAYTIFNVQYLSSRQLNDNIAIVEIDGKKVYLDPGQAMCPFGQMAWWHYLASGFGGSEKGAAFISVPANNYTDAVVNRVAQVELDPTGMITGSISVVMTGPEALRWRQLALRNDADEVKKRFNESLRGDMPDGVEAELNHFLGMDNPDSNLLAIVDISGNMGTVTGKRVFLPGSFFQSRGKHPFVSEQKRFAPIDVQYARLDTDSVEYSIPAGYSVESMPQATDHNWENIAVMKIVSEQKKDTVTVSRALAHNFILLKPEAYTGLHDFYLKVATADQQQVVLTRDGDAKGN